MTPAALDHILDASPGRREDDWPALQAPSPYRYRLVRAADGAALALSPSWLAALVTARAAWGPVAAVHEEDGTFTVRALETGETVGRVEKVGGGK